MNAQQPVGLIGLGLLGSALVERLIAAGFSVVGFDIDPVRRGNLAAAGGHVADSTIDIAQQCPRIVLSLPNSSIA
ncbi:MAG: NAD(P)-binding domain-containing protein, partial [Planctomycetaceae bacterium]|nr:NAD(P)-binding domain-containing protein [Planctomycetaceae bacterium]